ncbi:hypothetical protein AALP_AAs71240U000100 [Arabis alpina]|uniref:Arabidopsis retrotransposon Orf1 C-terminal domain-containing protein n=1 Tax=Arabis alpina TaxID=50452 RepID=A0A087G3D7_ARAAL|nr:hypothetical protein AALP_AAs71240U000100 [Arabis alpina]
MAKRSRTSDAYPWPKKEGERIHIGRKWRDCPEIVLGKPEVVNRRIKETWDAYDSLFYNQWLSVKMQPTRIADRDALAGLGIYDEVTRLLERSGLGRITTTHHDLYPDLVCQFFATLRIFFPTDAEHTGGNGTLTFLIEGVRYKLSIKDICDIYGFPSERDNVIIPPAFSEMKGFWRLFGAGEFSGNKVSHTDIRHPDLNWGAVLADRLLEQKNTPFTLTAGTSFRAGSLITPIMRFYGIDLERYSSIRIPCSMDSRHMGRQAVISRRTTRRVSASRRGSSSASAAAGSSSSARRLASPPQVDMDPVQRWIVTSIQTLWDAFADLSRCGCVRPRSPTPPPASSPVLDDDYAEIDAYHAD